MRHWTWTATQFRAPIPHAAGSSLRSRFWLPQQRSPRFPIPSSKAPSDERAPVVRRESGGDVSAASTREAGTLLLAVSLVFTPEKRDSDLQIVVL
jgi:hypothetical protein